MSLPLPLLVSPFTLDPLSVLDPAVGLLSGAVLGLSALLQPWFGDAATAATVVLLTLAVRAALLPLALRAARGERARQRLAPELARLRQRHGDQPQRLAAELAAAHRRAGVSPVAGLGPALAQAPVIAVLYRLCLVPVIAGAPNPVLAAHLGGLPLAVHLPTALAAAAAGGPGLLPALAVVAALLLVAGLGSVQGLHRVRDAAPPVPAPARALAAVLPWGTLLVASAVPLAVCLYLATSAAWSLAERALLPRRVA